MFIKRIAASMLLVLSATVANAEAGGAHASCGTTHWPQQVYHYPQHVHQCPQQVYHHCPPTYRYIPSPAWPNEYREQQRTETRTTLENDIRVLQQQIAELDARLRELGN